MQKVSPLIKQIAQLLDARLQTVETNIRAEIAASEKKMVGKLNEDITLTEKRMTGKLNEDMRASEKRLTRKLEVIEDKIDSKIEDLDQRIERIDTKTL